MALIEIIVGSESDLRGPVKESGVLLLLDEAGASYQVSVLSAHRNLAELLTYCRSLLDSETERPVVFVAIAGLNNALAGAIAGAVRSRIPVIGVALTGGGRNALDHLPTLACMPAGTPVLWVGGDKTGLMNATVAALSIAVVADRVSPLSLEALLRNMAEKKPARPALSPQELKELLS